MKFTFFFFGLLNFCLFNFSLFTLNPNTTLKDILTNLRGFFFFLNTILFIYNLIEIEEEKKFELLAFLLKISRCIILCVLFLFFELLDK